MRCRERHRPAPLAALALTLAAGIAAAVGGARPAAADITDDDVYGPPRSALGYRIAFGVRNDWALGSGIDPVSPSRSFGQTSLSALLRLGGDPDGGVSLYAGLGWDHGSADAPVRAASASFGFHRLSLPIQAQLGLGPRLALFGRLAPGAAHESVELTDASAPAAPFADVSPPLSQSSWVPAVDASAGASLRFASVHRRGTPRFGFWLTAELGYAWVATRDPDPELLARGGDPGIIARFEIPVE